MKLIQKISRVIFSRATIAFLLLAIQIIVIIFAYLFFSEHLLYFFGGFTVVSTIVVIHILNNRQNPAFQIAWIILIFALPVFGIFMYLWVRSQLIPKKLKSRLNLLHQKSAAFLPSSEIPSSEIKNPELKGMASYLSANNRYPLYSNTKVVYFPSGEAFFPDLLKELKKAKKFIFLEFFIIERGKMWNSVLEILKEKQKEGVEVRVLYDGTCSISLLPWDYPETLASYGIACKQYSPLKPFISTYHNNRDHRKIIVIDGKVSYTGGVNLADEYINEKMRFGYWKDVAIKFIGNATNTFTTLFLEMWNIDTPCTEVFLPYLAKNTTKESGFLIPYGDHPFDQEEVGKNVYLDMIHQAHECVHIMTPYLILDHEMITAMKLAAQRGVEVIIIMPHIPDKLYAYLLARTYYEELMDAGVKIYEFTEGFVHAKVVVRDHNCATVGTVNFDYRSFYLHYECGCYLFDHPVIPSIEKDFQATLQKCQKITIQNCKEYPLWKKAAGKILRLFAPLM